jgi:transposase
MLSRNGFGTRRSPPSHVIVAPLFLRACKKAGSTVAVASPECRQHQAGETIPGIGVITATAIAATVTDPSHFQSGRQFAAWLGLVPRQSSSGGKERLGSISKMGDRYLRTLLVVGATSVIRYARGKNAAGAAWINSLLARRPARLVSVALANKTARIAWAVLTQERDYRKQALMAA